MRSRFLPIYIIFVLEIIAWAGLLAAVSRGQVKTQAREVRFIPLPEAEEPHDIKVENDDVFLSDRESILVYSLKDGHLRRRIGQRSQGPGEFIIGPLSLTVVDDRLIAGDIRRIIIFSLQGDYLGQVREPALLGPYNFLPVGSNFVGFAMERQEDGSFSAPMGYIYN